MKDMTKRLFLWVTFAIAASAVTRVVLGEEGVFDVSDGLLLGILVEILFVRNQLSKRDTP